MNFYPHRTVEEQAERLPEELREAYKSSQLDRITIDGVEIFGYFEYSFLEEKSYVEQPVRTIAGIIEALNEYTTFLTPRLIIKYNMMGIEDYRKLMKLLKSKNAFDVTCYDVVEDKRVTHEMYFSPPAMPIIYQQYLRTLGIQEYSIELIGTNRKPSIDVIYDYNLPEDADISINLNGNYRKVIPVDNNVRANIGNIVIDTTDESGNTNTVNLADIATNYIFVGWNTEKDGSGSSYNDNEAYYILRDIVLYAQWRIR